MGSNRKVILSCGNVPVGPGSELLPGKNVWVPSGFLVVESLCSTLRGCRRTKPPSFFSLLPLNLPPHTLVDPSRDPSLCRGEGGQGTTS